MARLSRDHGESVNLAAAQFGHRRDAILNICGIYFE
jgi:hypothetical protein